MQEIKTSKACHIEIDSSTYSLRLIVDKSVEKKLCTAGNHPPQKKESA